MTPAGRVRVIGAVVLSRSQVVSRSFDLDTLNHTSVLPTSVYAPDVDCDRHESLDRGAVNLQGVGPLEALAGVEPAAGEDIAGPGSTHRSLSCYCGYGSVAAGQEALILAPGWL